MVGDFDVNEVVATAARYVGSLPAAMDGCDRKRKDLPGFPVAESVDISVDTEIPKALALVAYPTADFWNVPRTRRLSALADVVSDRLREKIREKLGASYSPFAYNRGSRAYPGYGVFLAMVQVAPEEAPMVVKEVKKLVAELLQGGVSEEELRRAINPALTGIKDMRRTNGYWLDSVLTGSRRHPQQLDWSRSLTRDYAAITAPELSVLARKYLNNRKAATIIIKPNPDKREKRRVN